MIAVLLALSLSGCTSLSGGTYVRMSDGSIGPPLANVAVSFVKEDGSAAFDATSDASGRYEVMVAPGRYYALASHPDHADYNSAPGVSVVYPNTRSTLNFFLSEPQLTTLLIVRHGEKKDPNSSAQNEPLSDAGEERARALRETLLRSNVTAVYSTDTVRTLGTVDPLAKAFHLNPQLYSSASALASDVLSQHRGDVVLVAVHSNTAAAVANAFGAQIPTAEIADFDNLYVVSVAGTSSNAVNLQYAADSTPDVTKNARQAMTLLLVGSGAPAGAEEPQQLLHAALKAEVAAIYTSATGNQLVAPLATALGLTPASFDGSDMPAFTSQLTKAHPQDTVVVAASNDELRELIRQLNGNPFPVIYASDVDHLIVLTRFASGAVRVVPLRY